MGSQDWARLLYVGDTLFVMRKLKVFATDDDVPEDVKQKGHQINCIEIEFRLLDKMYIYFWYYDTAVERDEDFDEIDEDDLRELLMKEIE